MRNAWLRFGGRQALGIAALLCATVVISWCLGTGIRSFHDLRVPTAYLDLERSDVIDQLAHIRAARDGHFAPIADKTIPELGAPSQANWSDWPLVEEIPFWLLGPIARATDIFIALNLGLLVGHLLAALTFFGVARQFGVSLSWSFLGGFAFGLSPYLFAQSPHHTGAQLCWHLPLFLPVWRWVTEEPGIAPGSRRFWYSIAVGAITGVQCVYFTLVFCQLVLLGALVNLRRTRTTRPVISAGAIIAATAATFGLMNLDTWLFRLVAGPNPAAVVRPYQWLEIYALKAVDLICPPSTHVLKSVATWAAQHWRGGLLLDEGSYLGTLGIIGLLAITAVAGRAIVRREPTQIPLEAWQSLWIFAFFTTGGLNLVLGLFGFTLFRANCRLSVVLLAIALMYLIRKLSDSQRVRAIPPIATAALVLLVALDQIPRAPSTTERSAIERQINDDRDFVRAMEKALPRGAMVLQLPFVAYPESPLPGMTTYDHLRPYLYSTHLRFSFGSIKGRKESDQNAQLAAKPLTEMTTAARAAGFRAIYINRGAIRDRAEPLVSELRRLGYDRTIESRRGDLLCVILPPPSP